MAHWCDVRQSHVCHQIIELIAYDSSKQNICISYFLVISFSVLFEEN